MIVLLTNFCGGKTLTSRDGNFKVTFDKPGVVDARLTVKDSKELASNSTIQIVAGNQPPEVKVEVTGGNKTFYFPGTPVNYNVSVTDKEDGGTDDRKIEAKSVAVTFNYLKGFDMTQIAQGHQVPTSELPGKMLIAKSDCKSCHMIDQKSAGPAYKDVAQNINLKLECRSLQPRSLGRCRSRGRNRMAAILK